MHRWSRGRSRPCARARRPPGRARRARRTSRCMRRRCRAARARRPQPACTLEIHMNNLADETVQGNFLHVQALITRYEVMDLLCKHLNLPRTQRTYAAFNDLGWYFAQKLIRQDGKTFWATDTCFPYGGRRRDVLRIEGAEISGRGRARRVNALCCQAVVFLTITNLSALRATDESTKTFVIGRWFQPHSSAASTLISSSMTSLEAFKNQSVSCWLTKRSALPIDQQAWQTFQLRRVEMSAAN